MADFSWSDALERTGAGKPGETFLEAADLHVRVVDAAQIAIACHLDPGTSAPPGTLADALAAVTGHALPLVPNTRSGDDDQYTVWLEPARWLFISAGNGRWPRLRALQRAVATGASPVAAADDMSDGLAMLELAGARAPALMAMASALDFEAAASAPPRTARAAFAGVGALVYRHGTGFRAHVDAALIAHVRLWLEQAARLLPRDRR